MLRPATPLTIIFLVAFVLLLLSTLSTPIIQGIPLGSFQGYNFGVFGYCKGSKCSPLSIGYNTEHLFTGANANNWDLPSSTRHSLSSILIIHPIATFFTLVCLCMAIAAHFQSPSHSPRDLLALFILTIPTFLLALLAFLVDILLFIPHMKWGAWIVLGATILVMASTVMTCAMRRTLVSRKARKKRIAENADMSGANYYENLAQNRMNNQDRLMTDSQLPRADSPPPMSGTTAVDKGQPQFAAFEMKRHDTQSRDGEPGMPSPQDDQAPLNPMRDPSIRSNGSAGRRQYRPGEDVPPMPRSRGPSMDSNGRPRRPTRDEYGNPIPPGMAAEMPPPGLRHQGSQGSMGSAASYGSRGRGRGGYGPPPRGYGAPRGGYGPARGGYGPRGGYRGGPPPPGFNGRGRGGYGPPPGMRGPSPSERPGPPPGYANDGFYGAAVPMPGPRRGPSPHGQRAPPDTYVAASDRPDMPIGQAIEMDERTGSPPGPISPGPGAMSPTYGLRDSDADVTGMVGLQQDRRGSPMRRNEGSAPQTPTSVYSSDQAYIPPRAGWAGSEPPQIPAQQARQYSTSPLGGVDNSHSSSSHPISMVPSSNVIPSPNSPQHPAHAREGSETYYEDVDPRFAVVEPSDDGFHRDSALPSALTPGGHINAGGTSTPGSQGVGYFGQIRMHPSTPNPEHLHPNLYGNGAASAVPGANPESRSSTSQSNLRHAQNSSPNNVPLSQNASLENIPEGARSPGTGSERASEASHFTSISERPVNPNWRPPPGPGVAQSVYSSAPGQQRRREDVILSGNPDFSIPGAGPPNRRGAGPQTGMGRGGGLTPAGRYPTVDI